MQQSVRTALLVLSAWTAVAVLFALQAMLASSAVGNAAEWGRTALWQISGWWSWALLTPVVVLVARRAMGVRSGISVIAVHVAAGLVVAAGGAALATVARWIALGGFRPPQTLAAAAQRTVVFEWPFHFLVYGAIVGVFYALRAGRLEAQLARARLDALTARLRPHFLYNALNTISALVLEDPKGANRMIARLSELLRQAFDRTEEKDVPLEQEIQLLEHYVRIQEMRFAERVQVRFMIQAETARARVPPLLLQPLVENAITHGMSGIDGSHASRPVAIEVRSCVVGEHLVLTVRDNGPGFKHASAQTEGVGLTSARARLLELYGSSYVLALNNLPMGGAEVRIEIPFQAACER